VRASISGAAAVAAWRWEPVRVLASAIGPHVGPAARASIPGVAGPAAPRRWGVQRERGNVGQTMTTADPTASASVLATPPGVLRSCHRGRDFRLALGACRSAAPRGTTVRIAPDRGLVVCQGPLRVESRSESRTWFLTTTGSRCRIMTKTAGQRARGPLALPPHLASSRRSIPLRIHHYCGTRVA
jgi:hypothetical protein